MVNYIKSPRVSKKYIERIKRLPHVLSPVFPDDNKRHYFTSGSSSELG